MYGACTAIGELPSASGRESWRSMLLVQDTHFTPSSESMKGCWSLTDKKGANWKATKLRLDIKAGDVQGECSRYVRSRLEGGGCYMLD